MINKQVTALFVLFLTLMAYSAHAQEGLGWLENTMFESGKINVVVGVVALVFILLVAYLFSIDRKVKKLEEDPNN